MFFLCFLCFFCGRFHSFFVFFTYFFSVGWKKYRPFQTWVFLHLEIWLSYFWRLVRACKMSLNFTHKIGISAPKVHTETLLETVLTQTGVSSCTEQCPTMRRQGSRYRTVFHAVISVHSSLFFRRFQGNVRLLFLFLSSDGRKTHCFPLHPTDVCVTSAASDFWNLETHRFAQNESVFCKMWGSIASFFAPSVFRLTLRQM